MRWRSPRPGEGRGLSPIVAVLALVLITSTLTAIVYVYMLSVTGQLRRTFLETLVAPESVMIDDVWYEGGELHVYVRNLGGREVVVSSAYVERDGTVVHAETSLSVRVEVGDVVEVVLSVELEEGGGYLVRVCTEGGGSAERRFAVWRG